MGVLIRIPTPLRAITNGRGEFQVEAVNVQEALDRLDHEFAGIKGRLCEDDGSVRRFVNVYVNDEDIRFMQGLQTALKAGDEVSIVPAMAGGVEDSRAAGRGPRRQPGLKKPSVPVDAVRRSGVPRSIA